MCSDLYPEIKIQRIGGLYNVRRVHQYVFFFIERKRFSYPDSAIARLECAGHLLSWVAASPTVVLLRVRRI
jgi:hypothetical protein